MFAYIDTYVERERERERLICLPRWSLEKQGEYLLDTLLIYTNQFLLFQSLSKGTFFDNNKDFFGDTTVEKKKEEKKKL